jgi:hypothetical protein
LEEETVDAAPYIRNDVADLGRWHVPRRCSVCGDDLVGLRSGASYCSNACRQRAYRRRIRSEESRIDALTAEQLAMWRERLRSAQLDPDEQISDDEIRRELKRPDVRKRLFPRRSGGCEDQGIQQRRHGAG